MNIFKLLKKKESQKFETLLQKAAKEPGHQAEFIKRMLTETFVVITDYDNQQAELNKLTNDEKIGIFTFDDGRVPIFTSEERIFDKDIFSKDVKILSGKGEYLLSMLKGKALTLNPYSDFGKEFSPEEVGAILNGTYFKVNLIQTEIKKGASVVLSEPDEYPSEIVKSLIVLFSSKTDVVAAYAGWIHDPTADEPPHYIFAIDTTGEMKSLSIQAIFVAKQFLPANEIVDFIQINDANPISNYFRKTTKPFYVKNR